MQYKLEDLIKLKTQGVNTTTDNVKYSDNGYKIVQAKNIEQYKVTFDEKKFINQQTFDKMKDNHILKKGDVLFTNIGSQLGNCAIYNSDEKAIITWNVMKLVPSEEKINKDFLCYLLNFNREQIKALNSSSTMPFVSGKELMNYVFDIPEINTQNKVVKILNTINNKIELNNKINDDLSEICKQLYKRWFIDFEFPNEQGKPYKSSGGKMVDAELVEIPENWEIIELGNIVVSFNGYSYKGTELVEDSNIGMATIKNFDRTGGFKKEGFKSLLPSREKEQHYIDMYEVAVAHTDITQNADIIGNPILILNKGKYQKTLISMDLVKVVSKDKRLNNFILYDILNSRSFKNHALSYVSGTTVLHLNKAAIKEYKLTIPKDAELIKKYIGIVSNNYRKVSAILYQNEYLIQLRDILLPKLMNGEINLDNLEI